MLRIFALYIPFLLVAGMVGAKETADDDKKLEGMSIVGNDEAPKSLVIVPWKSSDLGHALDVSKIVDDGRQPVDRDVFTRELEYYRIVEESQPVGGSETR